MFFHSQGHCKTMVSLKEERLLMHSVNRRDLLHDYWWRYADDRCVDDHPVRVVSKV